MEDIDRSWLAGAVEGEFGEKTHCDSLIKMKWLMD